MSKVIKNLQKQSENAISLVKATISKLNFLNESIAAEIDSNNDAISALHGQNTELREMKEHNSKIISNFENLLK